MVSCAGLTLSFYDVHKLSRHSSLWRPSSYTLYDLSFHTHQQPFSRPCLLMTRPQNQVVVDGFFTTCCTAGKVAQGNGAMGVGGIDHPAHVVNWRWLHVALMDIMISDVLMLMMWWCCLSQVTMATITMATGWLLLLVMMSMTMTLHASWPWPPEPEGKLQDVSHTIKTPHGTQYYSFQPIKQYNLQIIPRT